MCQGHLCLGGLLSLLGDLYLARLGINLCALAAHFSETRQRIITLGAFFRCRLGGLLNGDLGGFSRG